MVYTPTAGLLGPMESLAPNIGLLSATPAMDALQQMVKQRMMNASAPTTPSDGGGGMAAATPKPRPGVQPAPVTAPPPLFSPTQAGLMAGGLTALEESGPSREPKSLSQIVSRSLARGIPAFLASKGAEDSRKMSAEQERQYQQVFLRSPEVLKTFDPTEVEMLRGMGAESGMAWASDRMKDRFRVAGDNVIDTTSGGTMGPAPNKVVGDALYERKENGAWTRVAGEDKQEMPSNFVKDALYKLGIPLNTRPETLDTATRDKVYDLADTMRRSEADKNTINLPGVGANAFETGVGTGAAASFIAAANTIADTEKAKIFLDVALEKVDSAGYFGAGWNTKLGLAKIGKELFGLGDSEKIVNTEMLQNALNSILIPRLKEMGTRPSDTDLKELQKTIGEISNNPQALKAVLKKQREIIEKGQESFNQDYLAAKFDFDRRGAFMPPNIRPVNIVEDENGRRAVRIGGKYWPVP